MTTDIQLSTATLVLVPLPVKTILSFKFMSRELGICINTVTRSRERFWFLINVSVFNCYSLLLRTLIPMKRHLIPVLLEICANCLYVLQIMLKSSLLMECLFFGFWKLTPYSFCRSFIHLSSILLIWVFGLLWNNGNIYSFLMIYIFTLFNIYRHEGRGSVVTCKEVLK